MSTVAEIEDAIARLSPEERRALESRLFAWHRLDTLDEAEIERGECFTAEEMRASVRAWLGK